MDPAPPFEGVFGNTCELRLLQFLLPLEGMWFSVSELAEEEAGADQDTIEVSVQKFVAWGILSSSPESPPTYTLDPASPIVRSLNILNNSLIGRMIGDQKVQEIRRSLNRR